MSITGIGVDIVDIDRIKKAIKSARFQKICFTQAEIDYCNSKSVASFAGLFAAKESVAKAIGTGFKSFFPRDIEILHTFDGKPHVKLSKHVPISENHQIMLTIAHEKKYAVAHCIITQRGN